MRNLLVLREQLKVIYGKYSMFIDKFLQFVLALTTFLIINANLGSDSGLSRQIAQPVITLGLVLISTFLPIIITVVLATVLILVHLLEISMGIMAVTAVLFVIIYIVYLRFTPKMSVLVLITPLAFVLKMPYVIPIAFALLGAPVHIIPMACGTFVYFLLIYVKNNRNVLTANSADILNQVTTFLKQVLQNKEMLIMMLAFATCILIMYMIRRLAIENAWKIAAVSGALMNIIMLAVGSIAMDITIAYGNLIFGNLVALLVAVVLEFIFFEVDYTRIERLQYEDDEYYYFVKAVPKISVTAPEKTIKRIHERQEAVRMNNASEDRALQRRKRVSKTSVTDEEEEELAIQRMIDNELEKQKNK